MKTINDLQLKIFKEKFSEGTIKNKLPQFGFVVGDEDDDECETESDIDIENGIDDDAAATFNDNVDSLKLKIFEVPKNISYHCDECSNKFSVNSIILKCFDLNICPTCSINKLNIESAMKYFKMWKIQNIIQPLQGNLLV